MIKIKSLVEVINYSSPYYGSRMYVYEIRNLESEKSYTLYPSKDFTALDVMRKVNYDVFKIMAYDGVLESELKKIG